MAATSNAQDLVDIHDEHDEALNVANVNLSEENPDQLDLNLTFSKLEIGDNDKT